MYIARILYPIEVLGVGKRIGIWFVGCNHKCSGCSNPELWEVQQKYSISLENVMTLISDICEHYAVDGFTITGGEPFLQSEELLQLIKGISKFSKDILIYSGFTKEELQAQNKASVLNILTEIAVLVDGKYVESRNNGVILRGSDNQRIHILNADYQNKYDNYLKTSANTIQNFNVGDGIVSVGIHRPNFINELTQAVSIKGLEEQK